MLIYFLICVSLLLVVVIGSQFLYLVYLKRINAEWRARILELERHSMKFSTQLTSSKPEVSAQTKSIQSGYEEVETEDEEIWADVLE